MEGVEGGLVLGDRRRGRRLQVVLDLSGDRPGVGKLAEVADLVGDDLLQYGERFGEEVIGYRREVGIRLVEDIGPLCDGVDGGSEMYRKRAFDVGYVGHPRRYRRDRDDARTQQRDSCSRVRTKSCLHSNPLTGVSAGTAETYLRVMSQAAMTQPPKPSRAHRTN